MITYYHIERPESHATNYLSKTSTESRENCGVRLVQLFYNITSQDHSPNQMNAFGSSRVSCMNAQKNKKQHVRQQKETVTGTSQVRPCLKTDVANMFPSDHQPLRVFKTARL
jgi:hypothetical protein